MEYKKLPKTINEQIELLKERGLIIEVEAKLKRYLTNISYYHFSIYFKHFQKNDIFIEKTSFENSKTPAFFIFPSRIKLRFTSKSFSGINLEI